MVNTFSSSVLQTENFIFVSKYTEKQYEKFELIPGQCTLKRFLLDIHFFLCIPFSDYKMLSENLFICFQFIHSCISWCRNDGNIDVFVINDFTLTYRGTYP